MALRYAVLKHPMSNAGVRVTSFGDGSAVHGRLVALADIKEAGLPIIPCSGHISSDPIPVEDAAGAFSAIDRTSTRRVSSHWLLGPARFANHSCNPNAAV